MLGLHKTERAILCELDCNSRQSLAQLGKKARLRKESVHYRITQLERKGIIVGYPAIVSLAKRGKIHAELFLRFHNVTLPLKQEMITALTGIPEVIDLASCHGSWDLLIGIVVNSINELNTFKNKVFDTYSLYIASSSLSLTIETYFFGRKYLVGKDIHRTQHIDRKGDEDIDELDERVLAAVSKNARQRLSSIAQQVGSTQKVVAYRLKKMERLGIIQKYTLALNLERLGLMTYKLLIRLKDSRHKNRLVEYLSRQQNTVNVREVLSDWNLEPTFEVESQEQFYSIVHDLERRYGESIMTHTALVLDQIHKTSYYS